MEVRSGGGGGSAAGSSSDYSGLRHAHGSSAWIESAYLRVSDWMDAQRRAEAAAALREEKLHEKLRESAEQAMSSSGSEKRRADRAEERARHLVSALRALERRVVDGEQQQTSVLQARARSYDDRTVAAAKQLATEVGDARWEQARVRSALRARSDAMLTRNTRQSVRDHLALPGMAACLVAPP